MLRRRSKSDLHILGTLVKCPKPRATKLCIHLDRTAYQATAGSQGNIECPSPHATATSPSLELTACSCIAYICYIIFLDNYTNARTCFYRLHMADQPLPMGGNMFDRNVRTNKLDTGGAIMPLPLNLIALIISYVGAYIYLLTMVSSQLL